MKLQQRQVKKIKDILKEHEVRRAHLFGSFARGDANKRSDVDLLIEFKGSKSLLDLSGLKIDLEEKLRKKVDVVTYRSIYPPLKPYIMEKVVPLL